MTSSVFSDRPPAAPHTPPARLIVLEGLPGGGKTTLARALRAAAPVIGEYTGADGATTPVQAHPPVADDQAHQINWLVKARLAREYLATTSVVVCDRDWLSSLAYAHSIAATDGGRLLSQRCAWALRHLRHAALRLGDIYVVLDVDAPTSLARRGGRLRPDHPWSTPSGLARLEEFYRDPAAALAPAAPDLAEHLTGARITHIPTDRPPAGVLADVAALIRVRP